MTTPTPGILLIAEPFLKDPNFSRTVVFVCEHHAEGTLGFVLNRKYNHTLDELINNVDEELQIPVFYGGPVQMDTIHFIHIHPDKISGSYEITNGIYWGGDFEAAVDLVRTGEISLADIRFFIGYSGWSGGQLTAELEQKTWLTTNATRTLVFHNKTEDIWKNAVMSLGGDYSVMVNFPTDPQLN